METRQPDCVAVLIPCFNEEQTIGRVVRDFRDALPDAKIMVGDNNSTDRTKEKALEAGADAVITCPIQGKGACVRQLILSENAEWYILVDGDATYPADAVHEMLLKAGTLGETSMVVGVRHLTGQNQPPLHKFGNRMFDILASLKSRTRVKDCLSGYRVLHRDVAYDYAIWGMYDGFQAEIELTVMSGIKNWYVGYVDCNYYPRPAGSESKLSTFRDGWKILKALLTYRPPVRYRDKDGNYPDE